MENPVQIIHYHQQYQGAFKALNLEWLIQYNLLEDRDMDTLDNPQGIIDDGGIIYLATQDDQLVGSAAVIHVHGEFELAKMAVAQSHRGIGLSKILLAKCLDFVRAQGGSKIILYSNSQLISAIALYERSGFKHVPVGSSPFVTADVKMELDLKVRGKAGQ